MADVSFESFDHGKKKIERELELMRKRAAVVGIPSDARAPDSGGINTAQLAYIMEKGSVVNKTPARPFMLKTRERVEERFFKLVRKYYSGILRGQIGAIESLKKLGVAYEGEMKSTFIKESFAPNAAITINGGWMRNKVNGKPFKVKGKKSSRPLIDTGHLRQSITSKVVDL